jgi:GH15 family glucan-1,4-alpha-glucosidase
MIPIVGFLPAHDPRVVGTVEAIQRELTVDGFVLRYQPDSRLDGVEGDEGAFLACTFADSSTLCGGMMKRQTLNTALRNDVGLLAEEYDPRARRHVGNFPQAFSHVGLINTAHNLISARGPAQRRALETDQTHAPIGSASAV